MGAPVPSEGASLPSEGGTHPPADSPLSAQGSVQLPEGGSTTSSPSPSPRQEGGETNESNINTP